MTFQYIPNDEVAMATDDLPMPEWRIWQALDGRFSPEAEAEAEAIMQERADADLAAIKAAQAAEDASDQ